MRMVIADDEAVISSGLCSLLDWKAFGFEIAGVYDDGNSAMEAILRDAPDLALLDISMPGLDGIEILKNIRKLSLPTKVIFISGFQDFQYAKDAVTYGAVDYLLKPVIKDELLNAVEKAISGKGESEKEAEPLGSIDVPGNLPVDPSASYLPVLAAFFPAPGKGRQEMRLMRFAYFSFLRQYFDLHASEGIYLEHEGENLLLLKGVGEEEAQEQLASLAQLSQAHTQGTPGFVVGERAPSLSEALNGLKKCVESRGELFFSPPGPYQISYVRRKEVDHVFLMNNLTLLRTQLLDDLMAMKKECLRKDYDEFCEALRKASDGRKEDACYYFCSTIRFAEERHAQLHLEGLSPDMKELLDKARSCGNFEEMKSLFFSYFTQYQERLSGRIQASEKKNILEIQNYIQQHYREDLSLEVMGREFYMNPYYFSSYFKKQTGMNYKDYLTYTRIQHAISLLLTTDMKAYEVAIAVGFSDVRAFNDAFAKRYGETPSAYKKRTKQDFDAGSAGEKST